MCWHVCGGCIGGFSNVRSVQVDLFHQLAYIAGPGRR